MRLESEVLFLIILSIVLCGTINDAETMILNRFLLVMRDSPTENRETVAWNQFLLVLWDSPKCRDKVMKPVSISYVRFTKMQRQWWEISSTAHLGFRYFKFKDKYCSAPTPLFKCLPAFFFFFCIYLSGDNKRCPLNDTKSPLELSTYILNV